MLVTTTLTHLTALEFYDSGIYIDGGTDGYLDFEADTMLRFLAPMDFGDEDVTSADKIEFYDSAVYIDGGADGYLDIEADTMIRILGPTDLNDEDVTSLDKLEGVDTGQYIDLGTTNQIVYSCDGAGTPFSTPAHDFTGSSYFDADMGILLDKKLMFGDTGVYIFSDDDTYLDLVADGYIRSTSQFDLNPAGVGSQEIINITPSAALTTATTEWDGIYIDGGALDPSSAATDTSIHGIHVDMSDVLRTYFPEVEPLHVEGTDPTSTAGQQQHGVAGHFAGKVVIDLNATEAVADVHMTALDIIIDTTGVSAGEIHAIDVDVSGGGSPGDMAALATHTGIAPIHQHVGTFIDPDTEGEYAGEETGGGVTYDDNVDGETVFVADSDTILIGSASKFDELEIILGTAASKTIFPFFYYNTAADAWTRFYPEDDTDGMTQSGTIRFEASASWTADGDPGGASSATGYWMKIERTRVAAPGTVVITTAKTLAPTEYSWDATGAITALSLTLPEGGLANDTILEADLKAVDGATDEDILTKEDTTGDFEWHSVDEIAGKFSQGALTNDMIVLADIDDAIVSGSDATIISGTKGTNTYVAIWNADGDLVDGAGVPYVVGGTDVADADVVNSLTLDLLDMAALTSAPGAPVAGVIYYADNDTWDPSTIDGTNDYYVIYDGAAYIALFDEDGTFFMSTVALPTLQEDEWNDEAGARLLTVAELQNKIISNSGQGALHFDIPAEAENWNFIFIIETAANVAIHCNDSADWYLNGTVLAADRQIENEAPTVGESIACFSTEAGKVYCESKYADWVSGAED